MEIGCVFSVFQDMHEGTERAKLLAYKLHSVLPDFWGVYQTLSPRKIPPVTVLQSICNSQ